jgi:hypothetical protein
MRRPSLHILSLIFFVHIIPRIFAASQPTDPLPPGVSLVEIASSPPQGYAAQALLIDWSEPLLVRSLSDATKPGRPAPELSALEQNDPEPLRIHLSEPAAPTEQDGGLALPLGLATEANSAPPTKDQRIAFPAMAPWLPIPENYSDIDFSPLAKDADWAAVRWLGRGEELDQLPSIEFENGCLLSITQTASAQTRFVLINRTSPGAGRLGELRRWLKEISSPADWIALHSVGTHAFVGLRGWRLGESPDPRRPQRAGGILELRRAKSGDPVDWLRQSGVRLRSSESEPGFIESAPIGNPLIPDLLAPLAWVSLAREDNAPSPFYMATFQEPRLVERIEIAWAEAAGWSKHFNPADVSLQIAAANQETPRTVFQIKNPSARTIWTPPRPIRIRAIRLVFDESSQMPSDSRARLAALQVWGPLE